MVDSERRSSRGVQATGRGSRHSACLCRTAHRTQSRLTIDRLRSDPVLGNTIIVVDVRTRLSQIAKLASFDRHNDTPPRAVSAWSSDLSTRDQLPRKMLVIFVLPPSCQIKLSKGALLIPMGFQVITKRVPILGSQ